MSRFISLDEILHKGKWSNNYNHSITSKEEAKVDEPAVEEAKVDEPAVEEAKVDEPAVEEAKPKKAKTKKSEAIEDGHEEHE